MRRGPGERLAAWLYTGPVGHFWSTAADLGVYAARSSANRVLGQRRLPGSGSRSRARR